MRVLVVDDDADMTSSTVDILSLVGLHARGAGTCEEALRIAGEWLPHVALLDLGLAGTDGFRLAQLLRALPGLSGLELIALTGFADREHRARAEAAGFRGYLLKPVESRVLFCTLDEVAKRLRPIPRIHTMAGAERSCPAPDVCRRAAPLEQIALSHDWKSRARYVATLSRDLATRTRAELREVRSLIARGKSRVQEGRVRIARAKAVREYRFLSMTQAIGRTGPFNPLLCGKG
jgi:CheY-like chemotaxis protein